MSTSRFPPGKVPWEEVAASVRTPLPPEVLLGPACGEDAALVQIGGEVWAVASDPITFTSKDAGRLAVLVNANDVAVRGAVPTYFTAVVLLSPEDADRAAVGELLGQIRETCEELGVALIGGHTEVSPGLPHAVIAGTMLGRVAGRPITTGGLRAGDRVGMTRWAGLEGTSILLGELGPRLEGRLREAEGTLDEGWISVVPEAAAAAACPAVSALHDVTEGGVGEALHEMASASGLAIEVDRASIPALEVTRELCALLGMDPLGLIGSGSLLVGCAAEGAGELEKALGDLGVPLAWIGEAREAQGPPTSSLPRFERDEILKAWLLEGMEACVFDMDGTLIDSEYDWSAIRTTLGVSGPSIIDDLNGFEGSVREEKWRVLSEIEHAATRAASAKPGAIELLAWLAREGVRTALVTNNSQENTDWLLGRFGLSFDEVITRDSGLYKPSGAPVAEAVRRLRASPERTLCVGDSRYDVLSCRDAGCAWMCIVHDAEGRFSPEADLAFDDLHALRRYLELTR